MKSDWFDRGYLNSLFPHDPPAAKTPPPKPKRKWRFNSATTIGPLYFEANTKSEARALLKKHLGRPLSPHTYLYPVEE